MKETLIAAALILVAYLGKPRCAQVSQLPGSHAIGRTNKGFRDPGA